MAKNQKKNILPSAKRGGTRQRGYRWMPLGPYQSLPSVCLCRVPGTRQRQPLPSAVLCQVPGTQQRPLCRVPYFAECGAGKAGLCRVPEIWHSANNVFPVVTVIHHRPKCHRFTNGQSESSKLMCGFFREHLISAFAISFLKSIYVPHTLYQQR